LTSIVAIAQKIKAATTNDCSVFSSRKKPELATKGVCFLDPEDKGVAIVWESVIILLN